MALDDKYREAGVPVGTRLVAHYKSNRYVCEVVEKTFEPVEGQETPAPVIVYRVGAIPPYEGGDYKSPSSAASAFMEGKSRADGWKFWSIEGEEPAPRVAKPKAEKKVKEPKAAKVKTPKAAKTSKAKSNGAKADGTAKTPRTRRTAKQEDPKVFVEGTDKYIYRKNAFAPNEFYCEGCLGKFTFEGPEGTEPADCPNGHVEAVRAQTA